MSKTMRHILDWVELPITIYILANYDMQRSKIGIYNIERMPEYRRNCIPAKIAKGILEQNLLADTPAE